MRDSCCFIEIHFVSKTPQKTHGKMNPITKYDTLIPNIQNDLHLIRIAPFRPTLEHPSNKKEIKLYKNEILRQYSW